MRFEVTIHRAGGFVDVAIDGEIDMSVTDQVEQALIDAVTGARTSMVCVDLGRVSFIDSLGINALVRGYRAAVDHDVVFLVTNARGGVRRVLEVTGVYQALTAAGHSA